MKRIIFFIFIIINFVFVFSVRSEESKHFKQAQKLYNNKEFDQSKIFFERDIVFNPKSEKSYLYLAKIFNKIEDSEEEEIKLNSVILINPKNEEAIYMLIDLKITQSDFDKARELLENLKLICDNFCEHISLLEKKL